jgi:hypothetical protein
MIIYGYKHREMEQGTGNFYCVKCEVQRPYRHKKIVRYFTLFFIPLFPLGTISEYVECQVCGRSYNTGILSAASTTSAPISETNRYISTQGSRQNVEGAQQTGQKNSCLPLLIAAGGIMSVLGGLAMGVGLIATQTEPANQNIASFILAVLCCPTPLVIFGLLAIGASVYLIRKKDETPQSMESR